MCGICGYLATSGHDVEDSAIDRMTEVLEHRGPDGVGSARLVSRAPGGPEGWMGHRRLKILDLSHRAEQPMSSDDGEVLLTYNGEIYNFRELRSELRSHGARFRSEGDTEVVLRAYERWGDRFVTHLDGMFALAIWDARDGKLLLARDRTGKKPLFYTTAGGRFTFGSEIKALLACPWVERRVESKRLPEFLTFGYVPNPHTLYEGVMQVPPASCLTFSSAGVSRPRFYWDALPESQPLRAGREVHSEIAELLRAATRRRMVADVPLGALLSGGIDSSIVVGLMSQIATEPVHTFSIGFPDEPSFDERGPAQQVAAHFGTRHTDFAVELDAVALMDRLLWHHDQPYADSSAIPTYVVSRLARQHVTVALNGDGGDEVFGGYDRFVAAAVSDRIPTPLGRLGRHISSLLPRRHGYYSLQRRAERFFELAHQPMEERYQSWIAVAHSDLLRDLIGEPVEGVAASMEAAYERAHRLPALDRVLYANFKTYLPDDLAVKMDRMSMANSLETRSPFLDTALIDYVARLPARDKVGLRRLKPLLRHAFFPLLPPNIWDRRKHGFGVPMGAWFRGELGQLFEDEVLAPAAKTTDMLDRSTLQALYTEHRSGRREHGFRLWTVLTLERWLRSLEDPLALRPPEAEVSGDRHRALA